MITLKSAKTLPERLYGARILWAKCLKRMTEEGTGWKNKRNGYVERWACWQAHPFFDTACGEQYFTAAF